MTQRDMAEALTAFFALSFSNYQLASDEDVFSLGFITSLFAMQLVEFVESRFEVEVTVDDLDLENFKSIDAIVSFVTRKRTEVVAA